MLRVVHMSDTHGYHDKIKVPNGDILIHSGDVSNFGGQAEIERFMRWWIAQSHIYKVLIGGNHDIGFDGAKYLGIRPTWLAMTMNQYTALSNLHFYLEHSSCDIWGLKIFGSPYSPELHKDWAFGYARNEGSAHWVDIPGDTDILVTHPPPYGKLDWAVAKTEEHAGCEALRYFTKLVKPKLHLFGHIHEDYGIVTDQHTIYSNASIVDPFSNKLNTPNVFDIDETTGKVEIIQDEL